MKVNKIRATKEMRALYMYLCYDMMIEVHFCFKLFSIILNSINYLVK